ncbi:Ssh1 protein [Martiniozyma asiatica (nom. inval.)]|nr:Ssh1 protein [Martiniozyma asiatica]
MSFRILDVAKPLASLLPEIELPYERVSFDDKIVYTIASAAIYLLASVPLSGIQPSKIVDPFHWLRFSFASQSGTLLELGVLPVLTAGFFWQTLAALRWCKVNFNSLEERQLFQSLQKITAIFLGFFYSTLLVYSGYFKPVDHFVSQSHQSGFLADSLIILQLTVASAAVTYLCELLEKGYGFGPGCMAFIAVTTAYKLAGSVIGFGYAPWSKDGQAEGVLVQLFNSLFSKGFIYTIYNAFTRIENINLAQVYLAFITLFCLMYTYNFRSEISIKSSKVRSMITTYPIRLFHSGALPLIFTLTVIYNANIYAYAFSKIVCPIPFIANWEINAYTKKTADLTSGLLYFISSSNASTSIILNLTRIVVSISFITIVCALFGRSWFKLAGSSGKDLARQFKEQDITVIGYRDATIARELNKLISSASTAGSVVLGLTTSIAEATGYSQGFATGVGIGMLCAMSVLEDIMTDVQQGNANGTQFQQVFG